MPDTRCGVDSDEGVFILRTTYQNTTTPRVRVFSAADRAGDLRACLDGELDEELFVDRYGQTPDEYLDNLLCW